MKKIIALFTFQVLSAILFSAIILSSCTGDNDNNSRQEETVVDETEATADGYTDGTWCAEVEYYNPNTGTRNSYDLDVEVSDNELTQINWPNGGRLDGSHFSSEDISDGECSFTSDKGNHYTVTLTSEGGCGSSDAYRMQNDIRRDQQKLTCPECGDAKDKYQDLCSSCQDEKEEEEEKEKLAETCPRCSGYKMGWDKLCSTCKDKELEETELEE